jgi:outer membrane protein assembly factor BamE (lipoprotein component of BamABCDE complex)
MNFTRKTFTIVCAAAVFICAACTNTVNRGHLKEDEAVSQIKVGITSKSEVAKDLGSPSSESSFGGKTWYYVSTIRQNRSLLAPKIIDQHTLEIAFDANDTVSSIKEYSLADSKNVEMAKRVTPSEGQQLGFFEQIFANLGRFNKSADNSTSNDHGHSSTSPTGYPGR